MFSNIAQHFKRKSSKAPSVLDHLDDQDFKVIEEPEFTFQNVPIETKLQAPHEQIRNDLAGFFSALREAAERFDMVHIAPLVTLDPGVRFQLRTITVKATLDNDLILRELTTLQPHIIKKAAMNCLKQSQNADHYDLSGFYGVVVVPGEEITSGEAVVTLANIGIERINLVFGFEGEHIAVDTGQPPLPEMPENVSDLILQVRQSDGQLQTVNVKSFPLVIGNSSTAGLRVQGKYVSREHATLYFDAQLQRVALQDHSRHGTWLNGKAIEPNGRAILSGAGRITLSSPKHEDSPVIEFSHSALNEQTSTPLVAPFGIEAETRPEINVVQMAENPVPKKEAQALVAERVAAAVPSIETEEEDQNFSDKQFTPLRENAPKANPERDDACPGQTMLAPSKNEQPFGYLQIRTLQGLQTIPITKFPFSIGREPKGSGFTVDAEATFVSREHLTLSGFSLGMFKVENHGLGRNNTFRNGVIQDQHFYYRPVKVDSENGWLVLGGRKLDEKSVEIRLLNNRAETHQ